MRLVNVSYNIDIEFAENCTEIISIEGPAEKCPCGSVWNRWCGRIRL